MSRRGRSAYKQNEVNAEKLTTRMLRTQYECIIQSLGIEDPDLLYFSYANQVGQHCTA